MDTRWLFANEGDAARELAKRQRVAWAVTLVGLHPDDCALNTCPLVATQQTMAIEVETGDILLQVIGGEIER